MTALAASPIESAPPRRRWGRTPTLLVLAVAVAIACGSYLVLTNGRWGGRLVEPQLIAPPLLASLLVANLISGIVVMALIGRRVAKQRARRSGVGAGGRLHTRLVGLFAMVAAVPVVLVTIFASLLFQYGVEFWFSGQAKGLLETSRTIALDSFNETLRSVDKENVAMAVDVYTMLLRNRWPIDDPRFVRTYLQDVYQRSLAQSVLFSIEPGGKLRVRRLIDPYGNDLLGQIDRSALSRLDNGVASVATVGPTGTQSLTKIPQTNLYLYSTRIIGTRELLDRMQKVRQVLADYHSLQSRSRSLQLQFNGLLLAIALLVVGVTIWVALRVADRLVLPVGELVGAARRVADGDLAARVPERRERDEVGTLARAFNQMTGRLEQQNADLLAANTTLENRRALTEAVMAGVSAGVVATAPDGTIRIANASAARLLGTGAAGPVGEKLADVAPELAALIGGDAHEAVVQVAQRGRPGGAPAERTLAVRIARTEAGPILTFDDITQQVLDQRRAAWADVARRIAHEIKNPLTPIQLAAERLQRRYGGSIEAGDTTFARLTDTIVRQVGDLRRMVDEFSSFARMPKPVFRHESLIDLARQSLFLHEVAHPNVRFELIHGEPPPTMVCDRRQIGQALTNIVKNAVEAIEAKGGGGEVVMTLAEGAGGAIAISVSDDGIGLPAERERIVEPYMTTRARGTGLGLAVVTKIVEEHHGAMTFADRPGGGTVVTMTFDTAALDAGGAGGSPPEQAGDGQLATLTRTRT